MGVLGIYLLFPVYSYNSNSFYSIFDSDDELSNRLNAGLKLDGPKQRDDAQNRNEQMNDTSLNIDCDAVDWSDEGEEDDDTPRNHDLLSQLAEESEDDCDQDTLQFSRYKCYSLEIDT